MNTAFKIRLLHKYLSIFVSIQLLLWTISGIYFAFNKIENIRGEQYRKVSNYSVDLGNVDFNLANINSLKIIKRFDKNIYIIEKDGAVLYLDDDGKKLAKISFSDAMEIVKKNTSLRPIKVEEITKAKKNSEYRGRELPILKIVSLNENETKINVYLNIYSGEIIAIRSMQWRIWDLLWGFHIMDWQERDHIDNLFLKIFSILALITSFSGILVFFKVGFKKRKKDK